MCRHQFLDLDQFLLNTTTHRPRQVCKTYNICSIYAKFSDEEGRIIGFVSCVMTNADYLKRIGYHSSYQFNHECIDFIVEGLLIFASVDSICHVTDTHTFICALSYVHMLLKLIFDDRFVR